VRSRSAGIAARCSTAKSTCVAERLRYLPETGPPELDCDIYRLILRQILRVFVRLRRNPRTRHLVAGAPDRAGTT
jgi:hypothetical protein